MIPMARCTDLILSLSAILSAHHADLSTFISIVFRLWLPSQILRGRRLRLLAVGLFNLRRGFR